MEEKREKPQLPEKCKVWKKCGGCQFQGVPYTEQIKIKQKNMNKLLKKYGNVKRLLEWRTPFITEIKYMQYLTEIKKETSSAEPMRQEHTEWFLLRSV